MSELITAARPYARAAFQVANETNALVQWDEMLGLCAAVAADQSVSALLHNPSLSWQQEAEIVEHICAEHLDERGVNFIRLLAESDRLSLLSDIAELFHQYRIEADGSIDAELISAHDTDQAAVDKIADALSKRLGKKVSLSTSTDAALIGGAIIRVGDIVIDGSIRGRLEKLATDMAN